MSSFMRFLGNFYHVVQKWQVAVTITAQPGVLQIGEHGMASILIAMPSNLIAPACCQSCCITESSDSSEGLWQQSGRYSGYFLRATSYELNLCFIRIWYAVSCWFSTPSHRPALVSTLRNL